MKTKSSYLRNVHKIEKNYRTQYSFIKSQFSHFYKIEFYRNKSPIVMLFLILYYIYKDKVRCVVYESTTLS